ncbi:MAG TPA: RNA polymerase sigma factor [Candidatus Paceibacterota bacterium]|nr:RNA polymerase sigma factor [Candidatus Paceibacterota bacterium]
MIALASYTPRTHLMYPAREYGVSQGMMKAALSRGTSMAASYEASFLQAFDEHADALFRHASFRLSNRERAQDITQEAFLKAWEYARNGNEVRSWKSFLYRILNNLIIDEYRKSKDESLDTLLEDDPPGAQEHIAIGSRAEKEQELNDELLIEQIRTRIPELPYGLRAALTLRYIDGFSPKEVAATLGISENVASVRIHRAIARLRELCGPLGTI